jgi:hypothetical protein
MSNNTFSSTVSSIESVRQYGSRFTVGISNLSVDHSSGLIYINPDRYIKGALTKTETIYLNYDRLPGSLRKHFEAGKTEEYGKTQFLDWVHKQVDVLIQEGKVFEPGDEMLGLHKEGVIDITFLRNTTVNQPLKIKKIKSPASAIKGGFGLFKGEVMKLQLTLELDVTSQYWKLRNDGIKGTTVPVSFKFFTSPAGTEAEDVSYDLLFPFEALKGRLAHLQIFSYANDGSAVSVKEGELYVNSSKYANPINLEKGDNEIYGWVKAETKTYWVEMILARYEFELMLKSRGHIATSLTELKEDDDMVVIESHEDYVVIREKTQILWGEMVCEVEISTPRENSSHSSLTLEMIASATLQNKKLGESLNKHSIQYRKGVEGVIDMLLNKAPEGTPTFRVDIASGRNALMAPLGKIDNLNDGRIFSKMAEVYPTGVVLEGFSQNGGERKCSLYFHPGTTKSMSTIIGGVAEGFAKEMAAMIVYLNNPAESGVDQTAYSKLCVLRVGMESWLQKAIQSQGIMKRMGRSYPHAAAGSKVRTAANFAFLNHKEGELPKIAINSNCGILKLLAKNPNGDIDARYCDKVKKSELNGARPVGYITEDDQTFALVFNPQLMNGAKIAAARSPMPMLTASELVVSNEVDNVLDVAHVLILPSVWGPSNEGDTDGDGIVVMNLEVHGLTLEDCLKMNKHPMGIVGYKVAYGNDPQNWPIAEFCSYEEKWNKKAVHWGHLPTEKEAAYVKKAAYITVLDAVKDEDSKKLVSAHYRNCVGTAYNICVVLTHQVLSATSSGKDSTRLQMALAVAWRLIYEGLGLGGYTPNSRKFFQLLMIGTFIKKGSTHNQAVYRLASKEVNDNNPTWETDGGLQPDWTDETTPNSKKLPVVSELVNLMELGHIASAESIVVKILEANLIAQNWKAIETAKQCVNNMDAIVEQEAISYGAVRRALGQGWDPAGHAQLEAENSDHEADEEAVIPRSLLRTIMNKDVLQDWVSDNLSCDWVRDALAMACRVHIKAETYLFNMNQEDTEH